jgi:hypothetical protein
MSRPNQLWNDIRTQRDAAFSVRNLSRYSYMHQCLVVMEKRATTADGLLRRRRGWITAARKILGSADRRPKVISKARGKVRLRISRGQHRWGAEKQHYRKFLADAVERAAMILRLSGATMIDRSTSGDT